MTGGRQTIRPRISTPSPTPETVEAAVRSLLAQRAAGATICPSEAARMIAGTEGDWRETMPVVHQAADELLRNGSIALRWKGETLSVREGPYRIGLPE